MVLEPDVPLGEADPVPAEEGGAEQLVRGQQVQQRVDAEHGARQVLLEGAQPQRPAHPHHPADDHVRAVLVGVVAEPLQGLVAEAVVVVAEEDVTTAGGVQADVARPARPARVLEVQHPQVRVALDRGRQPPAGGLARAVVAEQHLELRGGQALPQQGGDEVVEGGPWLVDRHDHAHPQGAVGPGRALLLVLGGHRGRVRGRPQETVYAVEVTDPVA